MNENDFIQMRARRLKGKHESFLKLEPQARTKQDKDITSLWPELYSIQCMFIPFISEEGISLYS